MKIPTRSTAFVACLSLASAAFADLLEFEAGGRVRVAATVEDDLVRLDLPEGLVEFSRSDFKSIKSEAWPERDWPALVNEARRGGALERYEAARWALGRGLVDESVAMLREAHSLEPLHEPTRRMVALLDRLAAPLPERPVDELQRLLPAPFRIERSAHLVLLHQHDADEAERRIELLERVFLAFYLEFCAIGVDLAIPPQQLPAIWFAEQADYQAFLMAERASAFLTTRGYYHPTRGLVASYDAISDPEQHTRRALLDAHRAELDALEERIERMPRGARITISVARGRRKVVGQDDARAEIVRLRRDATRQRVLLDLDRSRLNILAGAHEMVHQLVDVSGLAPRYADFPIWLHEGLAMQFESSRAGRWAGSEGSSELRLEDWHAIKPAPTLASILADRGLGRGYRRDAYAQAWSLVYFLRTQEPATWTAVLDGLRLPDPGPATPTERARKTLLASRERGMLDWEQAWRALFIPPRIGPGPEHTGDVD